MSNFKGHVCVVLKLSTHYVQNYFLKFKTKANYFAVVKWAALFFIGVTFTSICRLRFVKT